MLYAPGQVVSINFITLVETSNRTDPTSEAAGITPTVYRNGIYDASVTSFTLVKLSAGEYSVTFTIPSGYALGDEVDLLLSYMFSGEPVAQVKHLGPLESDYAPGSTVKRIFVTPAEGSVVTDPSLQAAGINAIVWRNGSQDLVSPVPIVTRISAGLYLVSWTIPLTYVEGDSVELDLIYSSGSGYGQVKHLGPLGEVLTGGVVAVSGPSSMDASTVGGTTASLLVFQNATASFSWRVAKPDGTRFNIGTNTVKMVIHQPNTDTVLQTITCTLSASDTLNHPSILDTITVNILPANVPTAGRFEYEIRDYTNNLIYGDGPIQVKWAPKP